MATRPTPHGKDKTRWSQHVTETSDALDLEPGLFESKDPTTIARSLKASAEHSDRRKSSPFRSAMSMLTFYANRAGRNLGTARRKVLERAKTELRALFGKEEQSAPARRVGVKKSRVAAAKHPTKAPSRRRIAGVR